MSSSSRIAGIDVALEGERGPSWWSFGHVAEVGRSQGIRRVVAAWTALVATSLALGTLSGASDWAAAASRVTGFDVDVTVHPPIVLAVLAAVWVGPAWGALAAYAAGAALALASGLGAGASLLFGVVGVVEIGILWASLVTLEVDPELRRWRDLWRYVVVGFIVATAASPAAFLWSASHGVDLVPGQLVWRGWIVSGFLQTVLAVPLLRWLSGPVRGWIDRSFGVPPRRAMRTPHGAVLVVGLVGVLAVLGAQVVYGVTTSVELDSASAADAAARVQGLGLFLGVVLFAVVLTAVLFTWELSRLGQRERASALRDPLTGCFNRRAFYGLFEKEADRSRRINAELSIIFFDIDHFKQVNDRYGHEVGDEVLRQLAVRVRSMLRETDLLFRWGGEEFVVILPHTTSAEAPALADRIRSRVSARPLVTELAPVPVSITLSLGTAGGFDPAISPDDLVARADAACYKAKLAGRDRVEAETRGTLAAGQLGTGTSSAELSGH